ncbi:hypothetical protein ACJMK2_017149 [Sinanodonta woodiana]|uniref:Cysteine and tyrosine-rich protein 1 n=1 Tax=Sinanodonta woodiana TaxID=1069815 RepID=A0ABD3UZ50_SINWO
MATLEKVALKFMSASICIIIGSLCNTVAAGSYCYKTVSSYGISYTTYQYCDYGCCYDYSSSPCCSINIGLIVGAVIGGLVGVALLISLICIIIHCSKTNTRRSTMVAPQVVTTNTQYVQPIQTTVYQPYYQVTAYPVYPTLPAHGAPSGQPVPPHQYNTPPAEPSPTPVHIEGTSPPADNHIK